MAQFVPYFKLTHSGEYRRELHFLLAAELCVVPLSAGDKNMSVDRRDVTTRLVGGKGALYESPPPYETEITLGLFSSLSERRKSERVFFTQNGRQNYDVV